MASKTIILSEPTEWIQKRIDRVILREPRAGQLQRLGEPRMAVFQSDGTGTRYLVDRDDVIMKYFDELLTTDGEKPPDVGGSVLFGALSLDDGIALRDALFDFFTAARVRIASKQVTA